MPTWRKRAPISKRARTPSTSAAGRSRAPDRTAPSARCGRGGGASESGYLLVPDAVGQGLAREGVARLLDILFDEEAHRRVFADTDPDNARSNALLRALGFEREGRLRAEWETHIGVRDSLVWGLLADEWAICRPP